MCPVAPSNVGSLTRLRCSIRPFQAGENATSRSLEAQELRLVLDVDASLGQAIDQQTFVFVLGKDQRVRKWADARAHVAEDCMSRLLACHPEIHGDGLPPMLDDRVSEADLAVQLERPRLHSNRARGCPRLCGLVYD